MGDIPGQKPSPGKGFPALTEASALEDKDAIGDRRVARVEISGCIRRGKNNGGDISNNRGGGCGGMERGRGKERGWG